MKSTAYNGCTAARQEVVKVPGTMPRRTRKMTYCASQALVNAQFFVYTILRALSKASFWDDKDPDSQKLYQSRFSSPASHSAVASGLASRLRLKHSALSLQVWFAPCRQRIGFSPEIETHRETRRKLLLPCRQRIGFS